MLRVRRLRIPWFADTQTFLCLDCGEQCRRLAAKVDIGGRQESGTLACRQPLRLLADLLDAPPTLCLRHVDDGDEPDGDASRGRSR